jgi:hypothetical protein
LSAVEEIRIKLESRLDVLEEEIESLRSALTALDAQEANGSGPETSSDTASATPPATTRAVASTTRRGRRGASSRTSRAAAAELERRLAETGGTTAVELARETGTDYAEVLARIQELERAGQGRKSG